MANSIEKAKIYQSELDRQMVAEAVTGWMEANAGMVVYNGGSEVKIPKITMDGLGSYSRTDGYPAGSVTLAYETMTMTQDRAQSVNLDAMDCSESNIDSLAGKVMGDFQRVHVAPEIDSYRLSALSRQLNVTDFESGSVKMRVKAIDEIPLLRTPSARMKTAYVFKDGSTDSGFAPQEEVKTENVVTTPAAKQINWIIMARSAPIAVSRADTIRIFDPLTWQKANAWHIDYRRYHDLWVPDNQVATLCANVGA